MVAWCMIMAWWVGLLAIPFIVVYQLFYNFRAVMWRVKLVGIVVVAGIALRLVYLQLIKIAPYIQEAVQWWKNLI